MTEGHWHPGSFTKNFSWGPQERGLRELYDVIRIGFANEANDVPRKLFRERVKAVGRPDYIPLNFFLLNGIKNGVDHVLVDDLVYCAVNFRHSMTFDKMALHAFNLSRVGTWRGAASYQSRPALWAHHYIADRLSGQLNWETQLVDANDIQKFIANDSRYVGETSRKLATNLNYLYKQGRLAELKSKKAERWWLGAVFTTLDRVIEERRSTGKKIIEDDYLDYMISAGFNEISGRTSIEKDLALRRFVILYIVCGGRDRFDSKAVEARQQLLASQLNQFIADMDPVAAFHPTNVKAVGAIPRACAMLARYVAKFETVEFDEFDPAGVSEFIRNKARESLDDIHRAGLSSSMTAEEILRLTRGE